MRPAVILLWLHAALFGLVALTGYFAAENLFGPAILLQTSALAAHLLSAALVALAILVGYCARDRSSRLVRLGLVAVFVFDLQVPILMARFPAIFEFIEADQGLRWFVIPILSILLAMVTAYQLVRIWNPISDAGVTSAKPAQV